MSALPRLFSSLPLQTSDEYNYACPKIGEHVYRQPWKIFPDDNNVYSGRTNQRIRITLDKSNVYDLTSGFMTINVALTTGNSNLPGNTDPPYVRFRMGVWTLIRRLRHLDNNQPIEEIYPYNQLYSMRWRLFQNQVYGNAVGPDLLGIGTKAMRNAWGASVTPVQFVLPIDLNLIRSGPFPVKYMANTQTLEMDLEDPSICMETNMILPNFTISNVEFHVYKLLPGMPGTMMAFNLSPWEEKLQNMIRAGQWRVMVKTVDFYQNAPVLIRGDYIIPSKTAAIDGIQTVMTNINNLSNTLVDDTMITFPKNDISTFQLKIFTQFYPEQPVECNDNAIEAYETYLNLLNAWKIDGFPTGDQPTYPNAIADVPIDLETFNTTCFLMTCDFRSTRYRESINPILNTDTSTTDIRFYANFNSSPPDGTAFLHYTTSSMIIGLDPNGRTYRELN